VRIGRLPCAAGLLLLSTVLAGCTSTVTGAASPVGGASAAPTGTAAPTGPPAPDSAQLQAAEVQLADLPSGWTAGTGAEFDGAMMDTFAECLGRPESPGDRLMEAGSPAFSDASGHGVHSSAVSYRSATVVDSVAALFRAPKAAACFTQGVLTELADTTVPPGASLGTPHVVVTPGSGGGPDNVVATAAVRLPVVTQAGAAVTVYADFVVLRGRTTTALLGLGSFGAPLSREVRDPVVQALARRIAPL